MSTDDEPDTSRSVVKTYVPAYQKDQWRSDANELDMSQSEFVRTMVQAGRRGFLENENGASSPEKTPESANTGPSSGLKERVQSVLSRDEYYSWDELLAAITDNIEARLDETLAELQDENEIRYSGRHGGYTLIDS